MVQRKLGQKLTKERDADHLEPLIRKRPNSKYCLNTPHGLLGLRHLSANRMVQRKLGQKLTKERDADHLGPLIRKRVFLIEFRIPSQLIPRPPIDH